MHESDLNRVEFFSKEDLAGGHELSKGEHILRNETKSKYKDINDVLELYNIKKYIDNDLYLKDWSQDDITDFKQKVNDYGRIIGQFMSGIDDNNILTIYEQVMSNYIIAFWELVNNQKVYKQISLDNFETIISNEPHVIRSILTHKNLVAQYNNVLRDFLLANSQSAEILLSIYEEKDVFNNKKKMYLPDILTIQDKENIVSQYIDSKSININYLRLILNVRNKSDFKISDKIRLKAKRREKVESDKIFNKSKNVIQQKYGVSIRFKENADKIKDLYIKALVATYTYNLNFIKKNNDYYSLFLNFRILFEYLDFQNRIDLVSKKTEMGVMERFMGIQSQNEYKIGISFNMSEMTSSA